MSEDTVPGQLDEIQDRLRGGERRMAAIELSLTHGEKRMSAMEISLSENTASTKRIETNTADLLDWMHAFQGALKVLEGFARLAKPIGVILGVIAAVSAGGAAVKHWVWP